MTAAHTLAAVCPADERTEATTLPLRDRVSALRRDTTTDADWKSFERRFDAQFPRLERLFRNIYGDDPDADEQLALLRRTGGWIGHDRRTSAFQLELSRAVVEWQDVICNG